MTGDECKCEACQCEGTMIERVAKAMEARRRELIAQPLARVWPQLARAAIEAMREPTEAMAMAASEKLILACDFDNPSVDDIKGSYRASIDAALTEKGEG